MTYGMLISDGLPMLLEDNLISETPLEERASHRMESTSKTWGTHLADEKECEALFSAENTRNLQEIMKIYVSRNEPGHVGRLVEASGIIRDDIQILESRAQSPRF